MELSDPDTITKDLFSRPFADFLAPDHDWPAREIAGDFLLLDASSAAAETRGRDGPLAGLGRDWLVFSISGTGDAWLISCDGDHRIAFLDHDHGPDAVPQDLDIDLGQWFQMADVLRQLEASEDNALIAATAKLLEQIAPGLATRHPYTLAV